MSECNTTLSHGHYGWWHGQALKKLDKVLWFKAAKIIEVMVPREERMQAAHELKQLKYSDVAVECRKTG